MSNVINSILHNHAHVTITSLNIIGLHKARRQFSQKSLASFTYFQKLFFLNFIAYKTKRDFSIRYILFLQKKNNTI